MTTVVLLAIDRVRPGPLHSLRLVRLSVRVLYLLSIYYIMLKGGGEGGDLKCERFTCFQAPVCVLRCDTTAALGHHVFYGTVAPVPHRFIAVTGMTGDSDWVSGLALVHVSFGR